MAKKGRYVYDWPMLMVTTDALVFTFFRHKPAVLLIKRGNDPFKGKWAVPGGFVEIDEELENAAARELAEETGLKGVKLEQMFTFGRCGRDPRGRQITITFMGIAENDPEKIKAGDDAAMVKWFDIDNLPADLAFDHKEMVEFGIRELKRKKICRLHKKAIDD